MISLLQLVPSNNHPYPLRISHVPVYCDSQSALAPRPTTRKLRVSVFTNPAELAIATPLQKIQRVYRAAL